MGKLIDLSGQQFGEWTVIERDNNISKKNIYWKCKCSCGTVRSVAGTSLRGGISVSCGCRKDELTSIRTKNMTDDLTGNRYGEWTVLHRDNSDFKTSKRGARWICKCSCGKEKSVLGYSLKRGTSKSCGHDTGKSLVEDLTGKRFHHLVVERFDGYETSKAGYSRTKWLCKCDCGNEISVLSKKIKCGDVQSCGCIIKASQIVFDRIEIGKKYNYWTVLTQDLNKKGKGVYYVCKCECGNIKSISASSIKKGMSKSCGCMRSNYRDLIGNRYGSLTVICKDEEYYGKGVFWVCQCDCGTIKSFKTTALLKGEVKSCGCMNRMESSKRKLIDISGKQFGRLKAIKVDHKDIDNNGNTSYYWMCECNCGNEIIVDGAVLRRGDIRSCGCLQAEESANRAKSRTIDLIGKRFGLLTVIERIPKQKTSNDEFTWLCQCDCGNKKEADGYYLRKGMISSCGCLQQSKYELYVSQYFDNHGLVLTEDYETQKRFDDLKGEDNGYLSYDFAVYKNSELILLIECQGQQHYEPIDIFGGIPQFEKQKKHDKIKKEYAAKLGVKLLEIPYTEDSYEKVSDILNMCLKEVNYYELGKN